jgi:hypothetical protein
VDHYHSQFVSQHKTPLSVPPFTPSYVGRRSGLSLQFRSALSAAVAMQSSAPSTPTPHQHEDHHPSDNPLPLHLPHNPHSLDDFFSPIKHPIAQLRQRDLSDLEQTLFSAELLYILRPLVYALLLHSVQKVQKPYIPPVVLSGTNSPNYSRSLLRTLSSQLGCQLLAVLTSLTMELFSIQLATNVLDQARKRAKNEVNSQVKSFA